ncbi:MAG TPA: hypothetical protein VEA69_12725 [Tepidisphaeraceae bacterium]|nr:hypothetical protein [Tepidisphaeraceae bacterium]
MHAHVHSSHSHGPAHPPHGHGHSHHGHGPAHTPAEWVQAHPLPKLPDVGRHEAYYAEMLRRADCAGDAIAHESWKVGQYITLGLDRSLSWEKKFRYFDHAMRRHCQPPEHADEKVLTYFRSLADLVRKHTGAEALRVASREDDLYALRLKAGQDRKLIARDAAVFFDALFRGPVDADDCPDWLDEDDFAQLMLLRAQWV